ncbi:hypothetical protein ON010_g11965 [Phytophthora cinnamomi]|nr:hypothetical protein ON010_g11965 [Phytophthora cinnamomi]
MQEAEFEARSGQSELAVEVQTRRHKQKAVHAVEAAAVTREESARVFHAGHALHVRLDQVAHNAQDAEHHADHDLMRDGLRRQQLMRPLTNDWQPSGKLRERKHHQHRGDAGNDAGNSPHQGLAWTDNGCKLRVAHEGARDKSTTIADPGAAQPEDLQPQSVLVGAVAQQHGVAEAVHDSESAAPALAN